MSQPLINFITYNDLDVELIDVISNLFGKMVSTLAWELMSGRDNPQEKYDEVREQFQEVIEKYGISSDDDVYSEFTNLLVTTYRRFAENIIKQEKNNAGEMTGLEAALNMMNMK